MNLEELDDDERTALVGLVLMIVDADDAKSEAEMAEFRAIAAELGRREFDEAFRAAKAQFKTVDDALAFAAADAPRALAPQPARATVAVEMEYQSALVAFRAGPGRLEGDAPRAQAPSRAPRPEQVGTTARRSIEP